MSLFVLCFCILVIFVYFELCTWFFEHWSQGSNLSRTVPFSIRVNGDAVRTSRLSMSHGNLSMTVFLFLFIEGTLIDEQQ